MAINLSPFRFVEDFSFPGLKYWRVDWSYSFTTSNRFLWEGSPTYPPVDNITPYGVHPGVHRELDPLDGPPNPIAANWPQAWIDRLWAQGYGDTSQLPGINYTKEIWTTRKYTRFFGFIFLTPTGNRTMGYWVFTASWNGTTEGDSKKKYFVTSNAQEEANLAARIEEWWLTVKAQYSSDTVLTKSGPVSVTKAEYDARPPE